MKIASWAWRVWQDNYLWDTVVIADSIEAALALIDADETHAVVAVRRLHEVSFIDDALLGEEDDVR